MRENRETDVSVTSQTLIYPTTTTASTQSDKKLETLRRVLEARRALAERQQKLPENQSSAITADD